MRPRGAIGAGPGLLAAMLALPVAAYPRPGRTELVSVAADGTPAHGVFGASIGSRSSTVSADGRFVAFSTSDALVPEDANQVYDVYLRDRALGATELVSVSSDEVPGNSTSVAPALSPDGRFVVFASTSTNLVPEDTGPIDYSSNDVFIRDRAAGTTEWVSMGVGGAPGAGGLSYTGAVSDDGRYVAFQSDASNLVSGDTNDTRDVFVRDRALETTERVSVSDDGRETNDYADAPHLSADARFVAFRSWGSNLAPHDVNLDADAFVRDRQRGTTELVSVATDGAQANASSEPMGITADGREVLFWSLATNLVPEDGNGTSDLFVHDRVGGRTERITVSSVGRQANARPNFAAISPGGRFVAWASAASNLVPGDTNGAWDAFVRDRLLKVTERVSVTADGEQATGGDSFAWGLSADGRFVGFDSEARNLVPPGGLGNPVSGFVRDRGPTVGPAALSADAEGSVLHVSGWATFTGAEAAVGTDPAGDAGAGGRELGADLTEVRLLYRPEQEDLLLQLGLARLPGTRVPASGPVCSFVGLCLRSVAGAPGVLYTLAVTAGGIPHEVRVMTASASSPTSSPYFGLYRCEAGCVEVARLTGGFGTTGDEVLVQVPLAALGVGEGSALSGLEASTAVGEVASGAILVLDRAALPMAGIPARSVELGVAPAGTLVQEVAFTWAAALDGGSFEGVLPAPGPGEHDVWARACLGPICGSAKAPVRIE